MVDGPLADHGDGAPAADGGRRVNAAGSCVGAHEWPVHGPAAAVSSPVSVVNLGSDCLGGGCDPKIDRELQWRLASRGKNLAARKKVWRSCKKQNARMDR